MEGRALPLDPHSPTLSGFLKLYRFELLPLQNGDESPQDIPGGEG